MVRPVMCTRRWQEVHHRQVHWSWRKKTLIYDHITVATNPENIRFIFSAVKHNILNIIIDDIFSNGLEWKYLSKWEKVKYILFHCVISSKQWFLKKIPTKWVYLHAWIYCMWELLVWNFYSLFSMITISHKDCICFRLWFHSQYFSSLTGQFWRRKNYMPLSLLAQNELV